MIFSLWMQQAKNAIDIVASLDDAEQAEPTTNNQCLRSGYKLVDAPDLLLIRGHWARSFRRQ